MKNTWLFAIIFLTTACSVRDRETNKLSEPRNEQLTISPYNLGGTWVNKQYIDKLRSTRSPRKAQDAVDLIVILMPEKPGGEASLIWGLHEGTSGILKEKEGTLSIDTGESNSIPISTDETELRVGQHTFIRASAKLNDGGNALAEEFLISGLYELSGREVKFTPDGRIEGIDSLTHYSVYTDYYDAGMQVDQISLGKQNRKRDYAFEMTRNDLVIYELRCTEKEDELCLEVDFGKKLMSLKRKQ